MSRNLVSVALWVALIALSTCYILAGVAFNGTYLLVLILGGAIFVDLASRAHTLSTVDMDSDLYSWSTESGR